MYNQWFTKLYFDTDVTFTGDSSILAGDYRYNNLDLTYTSNPRKPLSFSTSVKVGEYYSGRRSNAKAELNYRWQPWGTFGLSYNFNRIDMPHLEAPKDIALLGASAEMSFTKAIFFTTFFQYNTQANNFNINSRLQWRYRPLSDLYLVYSENYVATDCTAKNRALVLKFIYWFQ